MFNESLYSFEVVKVCANSNISLYEIFQKAKQSNNNCYIDAIVLEHEEDIDWEPIAKRAFDDFSSSGFRYFSLAYEARETVEKDYLRTHINIGKIDPDVFFFEDTGHPEYFQSIDCFLKMGVGFITTSKVSNDQTSPTVEHIQNFLKQL